MKLQRLPLLFGLLHVLLLLLIFIVVLNDLRRSQIELNHGVFDIAIPCVPLPSTIGPIIASPIDHLNLFLPITQHLLNPTGLLYSRLLAGFVRDRRRLIIINMRLVHDLNEFLHYCGLLTLLPQLLVVFMFSDRAETLEGIEGVILCPVVLSVDGCGLFLFLAVETGLQVGLGVVGRLAVGGEG